MNRLGIFFARVGGKTNIKKKIVFIIENNKGSIDTYIEPFVGGGSIFLYLDTNDFKKVVINDYDKSIAFIWSDLKKIDKEPLNKKIECTPYEFKKNKENIDSSLLFKEKNINKRFRDNIYLSKCSYSGNRRDYTDRYKNNPEKKYKYLALPLLNNFEKYEQKMKDITVLNKSYETILEKYLNDTSVFFYLDPPYSMSGKSYYDETVINMELMLILLNKIKGRFLLSYNNHPEIKKLSKKYGFTVKKILTKYTHNNELIREKSATELLISNFDYKMPSDKVIDKYFK